MRNTLFIMMLLGLFVAASTVTTGCRQSTRADVGDDEAGPESSGPYAADVKEVTREIIKQLKRQQVLEKFRAEHGEAPIVALTTPENKTRFPEVTSFFQQDLLSALSREFTREEIRFRDPSSVTRDAAAGEREGKEAGELTDRTGPRTTIGADYLLGATFLTLSMTDGHMEDDTIKYTYRLTDATNRELIFQGEHDIRRVSSASVVYR